MQGQGVPTGAVVVRARNDVLTVVRQRREALGLTHLEMDAEVGLTSGHYGKIERMGAAWGKQAFRLTSSMVWILDRLGLELIIAPKGSCHAVAIEHDVRLPREAPEEQPRPRMSGPGMVAAWRERRTVSPGQKKTRQAGA